MPDTPYPRKWSREEIVFFDNLTEYYKDSGIRDDKEIREEFHTGYFDFSSKNNPDKRHDARNDLEYDLWTKYGMEFDIDFEWLDYSEWYDATHG